MNKCDYLIGLVGSAFLANPTILTVKIWVNCKKKGKCISIIEDL